MVVSVFAVGVPMNVNVEEYMNGDIIQDPIHEEELGILKEPYDNMIDGFHQLPGLNDSLGNSRDNNIKENPDEFFYEDNLAFSEEPDCSTYERLFEGENDLPKEPEEHLLEEEPIEPDLERKNGWFVDAVGTYFEITDSEYLNVKIASSEKVHVFLESVQKVVSFHIEIRSDASSTLITLSGFECRKYYYRYQDGNFVEKFKTDNIGSYSYIQDVSNSHHISIQEKKSTIYLLPDGTIDPITAPIQRDGDIYTLTDDIFESIYIQKSGITLDGDGYRIQGSWALTYGVYMNGITGVTICNFIIEELTYGIFLTDSNGNTLLSNTVICGYPFRLHNSHNNILEDNTIPLNAPLTNHGIYLSSSEQNQIISNEIVTGNIGITLYSSTENSINSNKIPSINIGYNSNYNIIKYNVINGKDSSVGIYISSGVSNTIINGNTIQDCVLGIGLSGQFHILQDNIVFNNDGGINIVVSKNCKLRNNIMKDNIWKFRVYPSYYIEDYIHDIDTSNTVNGKPIYYWIDRSYETVPPDAGYIVIVNSNHITVKDLTLTHCSSPLFAGTSNSKIQNVTSSLGSINLVYSNDNIITENKMDHIELLFSNGNNINQNILSSNGAGYGIKIGWYCENNIMDSNIISDYSLYGISMEIYSAGNTANGNIITGNKEGKGIIAKNKNNNITNNTVSDNEYGLSIASRNCIIIGNTVFDNEYGIYIYGGCNAKLRNNKFRDNTYNFGVVDKHSNIDASIHDIDTSNTVDGKPIYYLVDQSHVNIPSNAGYIALINSDNITVYDTMLNNNFQGFIILNSTDIFIQDSHIYKNAIGIIIQYSNRCNIVGCNVYDNKRDVSISYNYGMKIIDSENICISDTVISHHYVGITLESSTNIHLIKNSIINPHNYPVFKYGIDGIDSVDCYLKENIVIGCRYGLSIEGAGNVLINNTVSNNERPGIEVNGPNCKIIGNTAWHNGCGGWGGAGISYIGSNGEISDNLLIRDYVGIYIEGSNNIISKNIAINSLSYGTLIFGNNNNIIGNTFSCNEGSGILIGSSGDTLISNNNILDNFYCGIYSVSYTSNNIITGNIISNNGRTGIYLENTFEGAVKENVISNNKDGIKLFYSDDNNLEDNVVSNNRLCGIYISSSSNNVLRSNEISNNAHNFNLYGQYSTHFYQDIDTTNTVDGKPIYYWIGHSYETIPSDAGYVGLVNSHHIIIKDLTLSNNGNSILFANTSDSIIKNVTISNNYNSIVFIHSDRCSILSSQLINNDDRGINLYYSDDCTISQCMCECNGDYGGFYIYHSERCSISDCKTTGRPFAFNLGVISLWQSHGSSISDCEVSDSISLFSCNDNLLDGIIVDCGKWGILLENSHNTIITNNIILNHSRGIWLSQYSSNNVISDNMISGGRGIGIFIDDSSDNSVIGNIISNNDCEGIWLEKSHRVIVIENIVHDNGMGIWICFSDYCLITGNIVTNNHNRGILLGQARYNILRDNNMMGNGNNFEVYGYIFPDDYIHDIDTSNTVEGKPIYYWFDHHYEAIPSDAGYIALINSNFITVQYVTLPSNSCLFMVRTNDCTIQDCNLYRIELFQSHRNTITENVISNGGMWLENSALNNIVNNMIQNSEYGIRTLNFNYNTISDNIFSNNEHGIYMRYSKMNILRNNIFTNNIYDFFVGGDFENDIDDSNIIDGKSILWLNGESDLVIEYDIYSTVYAINCDNIVFRNLQLNNNFFGIRFVSTTKSIIENCVFSNNKCGISFGSSDNNTIRNNEITNNIDCGISITGNSADNFIQDNIISNNYGNGIYLDNSINNIIERNNISNNINYGIFFYLYCISNVIDKNIITNNEIGIYFHDDCQYNVIDENIITNNGIGLYFAKICSNGYRSTITNNIISNNIVAGADLLASWGEIKYNEISNNGGNGLYIQGTITIIGNTISNNNGDGIYAWTMWSTINNNVIIGNNGNGLHLTEGWENVLDGNVISENLESGIYIENSTDFYLRNNSMQGNKYNFRIHGSSDESAIHDIDTSNTVDGKPIYFWIGRSYETVPSDAGYVAIIKSDHITVRDVTLSNNGHGLVLFQSSNCIIQNVNILNNFYGINIYSSYNCIIGESTISNNDIGFRIVYSVSNTISENIISDNRLGIYLFKSDSHTFQENIVIDNNYGFYIENSGLNTISENMINENNQVGILLEKTAKNRIIGNEISDNYGYGISLISSHRNEIYHNNVIDNTEQLHNYESANTWNNGKGEGNYWNDYKGKDLDKDGIGDTDLPHQDVDWHPMMKPIKKV